MELDRVTFWPFARWHVCRSNKSCYDAASLISKAGVGASETVPLLLLQPDVREEIRIWKRHRWAFWSDVDVQKFLWIMIVPMLHSLLPILFHIGYAATRVATFVSGALNPVTFLNVIRRWEPESARSLFGSPTQAYYGASVGVSCLSGMSCF